MYLELRRISSKNHLFLAEKPKLTKNKFKFSRKDNHSPKNSASSTKTENKNTTRALNQSTKTTNVLVLVFIAHKHDFYRETNCA